MLDSLFSNIAIWEKYKHITKGFVSKVLDMAPFLQRGIFVSLKKPKVIFTFFFTFFL